MLCSPGFHPHIPGSCPHTFCCRLEGCCCGCGFYEGFGPLVRSWGECRITLGSLRPLSSLCSLGKPNFFFSSLFIQTIFNIFLNIFSIFFILTFPFPFPDTQNLLTFFNSF